MRVIEGKVERKYEATDFLPEFGNVAPTKISFGWGRIEEGEEEDDDGSDDDDDAMSLLCLCILRKPVRMLAMCGVPESIWKSASSKTM